MEMYILETISVERLPQDLGILRSTAAGLLCSGRQDKMVIVSLFLLLFMVRQNLWQRTWLPLPTAIAPSETEGAGPNGRGVSGYSES